MMNEDQLKNFVKEKIELGKEKLKNNNYKEAWEEFFSAYKEKKDFYKKKRITLNNLKDEAIAEIAYNLANIIGLLKKDEDMINNIINNDEDEKNKEIEKEKAIKTIGRRYLKLAADNNLNIAIVDYVYNCLGYNPRNNDFSFDYNQKNSDIALYWAEKIMSKSDDIDVLLHSYCVNAIYNWDRYNETKDGKYVERFITSVEKILNEDVFPLYRDEYVKYTIACFYLSPEVKKIKGDLYFDPKKSHSIFSNIIENVENGEYEEYGGIDQNILMLTKKNKESLETKFSQFLK